MKVLYIGGTGEISYSCIQAGAAAGQDITVYNRGLTGEPLPAGVKRIEGDLDDNAAYAALGEQNWDVVCQFLAYGMGRVERDRDVFGGKIGQYVFISSASAYQKPVADYVITEQTPLENPWWNYSRDKAAMEKALLDWHAAGTLPVTIVRPSHTYRRHVPGTFLDGGYTAWRMLNNLPVLMHGDGTSLWTLTHSDDFAQPFVKLLGNQAALGEAFHITEHMRGYTWDTIFQTFAAGLGVEAKLVHVASETLCQYNKDWEGPLLGDKSWSVLFDNSKVMNVAGEFGCSVTLAAGLATVAEHIKPKLADFKPDPATHELVERIIAEQQQLGR